MPTSMPGHIPVLKGISGSSHDLGSISDGVVAAGGKWTNCKRRRYLASEESMRKRESR